MESSRPKHEIRDVLVAAGRGVLGAVGKLGGLLLSTAVLLFLACVEGLRALRHLIEFELVHRLQAAAASFLLHGRFGDPGGLQQLVELEDRRLQAGAFFLTFGGLTVLYGTTLNRSVNPEHILAGFFVFILGAVISILTLAGAGPGRAAAEMERFLRGFF